MLTPEEYLENLRKYFFVISLRYGYTWINELRGVIVQIGNILPTLSLNQVDHGRSMFR